MKKICLNEIKKVLSSKEMKNVFGGSGTGSYECWCTEGNSFPCTTDGVCDDCHWAVVSICGGGCRCW